METTNANKIALAVLGTLLGTMALGVFSNAVFATSEPQKPGFNLPGKVAEAAPAAKAAPEVPLPTLLAKASVTRGKEDAKACEACHDLAKGGHIKIGPPLWGVVGRPIATIAGFSYSDGLKKLGGHWTYAMLNKWITKPTAVVPDTKMSYPGEPEATKRADILAYLQTLSDSPVPFPK